MLLLFQLGQGSLNTISLFHVAIGVQEGNEEKEDGGATWTCIVHPERHEFCIVKK